MVDAIKFANVNYLQIDAIMARNIVELERINKFFVFNLSPNVYFSENSPMHGQIVQHNKQTFVKEEEGIYTKKTRNLSVEDE
ncbi:MAG: hypothetical protein MJ233_05250 [Mycoplasmoidaceae bacterium]|nr:hypothetical protein [Mycoplasmoidaceae bacterium]